MQFGRWAVDPRDMNQPLLSVVIVSYNCAGFLRACLDSLPAGGAPYEAIVVDNGSADGTVGMVGTGYPGARLIANRHNRGFAAACNQGIEAARGRHILLLNPDTVVRSGAFAALLAFMERTPDAGACGPRLLNPDGSLQASCHPFPSLRVQATDILELWRIPWVRARRPCGDHGHTQPADWLTGACLLLRREALDAVGPLDEDYWMFSEEVDWCYRARRAGWRTYLVAEAEVVHRGGATYAGADTEMIVELYRSIFRFYWKHCAPWRRAALALLVWALMLGKVLLLLPLGWGQPRRQKLRRAYWEAMWLGLQRPRPGPPRRLGFAR